MHMQITKPPHNRYALNCLDNATYIKYATVYSGCKRWGVRGIYSFLGGTGLWGVAREVAKGTVVQYGKRRLAVVVISGASYICAPAVAVITNATRVVKSCKVVYTSVGYVMEAVEDASHIPFLPLDLDFERDIDAGAPVGVLPFTLLKVFFISSSIAIAIFL